MTVFEIVARYVGGESLGSLARASGHCKKKIVDILRGHGVVVRYHEQYLPTPEEIEAAAREVRESWDEETRLSRSTCRVLPVTVPLCKDPHGGKSHFHGTEAI